MIYVTRLNNSTFVLNCDKIETMESNPDTVITLTTGNQLVVKESTDEIIHKIIEYRRQYMNNLQ